MNCQIVPWVHSKEWFEVYEKVYSSSLKTKEEALEILLVWKGRCPSLPAGIESTLGLLEVHIQDCLNVVPNEKLLRLAYATAMMRFVNHMLDADIAKGTSLHQAARVSDVPDWIIDLRHDTAHNNVLPSIEILREASSIGLEWLNNNYWLKHRDYIKDFVTGHEVINSTDENKVAVLVSFCTTLSVCASSKIKNLNEITDNNMREAIINDARELFANSMDFSNLKTVSIASLINTLNINAKRLLKPRNTSTLVNKALTSEDSLFLSLELLHFLCETDFYVKGKLSFQYMQCFEVLLIFLQTNDMLMDFVLDLIKFTNEDNDGEKRKLAALWVTEILQALKKSVLFSDKIKGTDPDQTSSKKRKELQLLYKHWFPNEKHSGLLLDLHKGVPSEWKDIKYIQPIISAYNPYLIYFVKPLLELVEPCVPKTNVDKICSLAKLISTPEPSSAQPSKVYTIEDLQSGPTDRALAQDPDSDCMEICEEEMLDNTTVCEEEFQTGIWQRASSNHNWSLCPVGILPWQLHKVGII